MKDQRYTDMIVSLTFENLGWLMLGGAGLLVLILAFVWRRPCIVRWEGDGGVRKEKKVQQAVNKDWDSVHATTYKRTAFDESNWIRSAQNLLKSATLLRPKIIAAWENLRKHAKDSTIPLEGIEGLDYRGVYFMLWSYAIENLLKAAIIKKGSRSFKNNFQKDMQFPKELKKHELVNLARASALAITLQEEDLLKRLTRSAIWYGRYPVPLNYKEMAGSEKFSDGNEYSVSWSGGNDLDALDLLLGKIAQHLDLSVEQRKAFDLAEGMEL